MSIMKRFLIAGGALLAAGALMFVIGMSVLGWNFEKLDSRVWEDKVFEVVGFDGDVLDEIEADIRDGAVTVKYGDTLKVEYSESESLTYDIEWENGKLSVEEERHAASVFTMFDFHTLKIVITVPEGVRVKELDLTTRNGGFDITGKFGKAELKTTNGAITLKNFTADSVVGKTTNGGVVLENVTVTGELNVTTTNSAVSAESVSASGVNLKTTNGAVSARDITAKSLSLKSTNGAIDAHAIDVATSGSFVTTNGNVYVKLKGAKENYRVAAHTTNGSVTGATSSGDISVECRSTNGNINVICG